MDEMKEKNTEQRNMYYYNQILNAERNKKATQTRKTKAKSFANKRVDFKDYIYVPEEWEGVAYTLYVLLIPYIVGSIFLFLTIARGNVDSYKMLDTSSFPIVWAIGYEIVAIIMLIWITMMFLQYDGEDDD